MYGWKAFIGVIAAGRGDTFMYEFYKIVPQGVVLTYSGASGTIHQFTKEDIDQAIAKIDTGVTDLAKVRVDYIYILGNAMFTSQGVGSDRRVIHRFEEKYGIPVNTGITAEVDALKRMNIRRVAVVTPYEESMNDLLAGFLTQSGFEVAIIKGMGICEGKMIAAQPDYAAYRFAKSVHRECPDVDGIYLSSGRWPTINYLERLEKETGLSVVASTAAYIWAAFTRLKIMEHITGYGRLLEMLHSTDHLSERGGKSES